MFNTPFASKSCPNCVVEAERRAGLTGPKVCPSPFIALWTVHASKPLFYSITEDSELASEGKMSLRATWATQ